MHFTAISGLIWVDLVAKPEVKWHEASFGLSHCWCNYSYILPQRVVCKEFRVRPEPHSLESLLARWCLDYHLGTGTQEGVSIPPQVSDLLCSELHSLESLLARWCLDYHLGTGTREGVSIPPQVSDLLCWTVRGNHVVCAENLFFSLLGVELWYVLGRRCLCVESPIKSLGTESLMIACERQHFTCAVVIHSWRNWEHVLCDSTGSWCLVSSGLCLLSLFSLLIVLCALLS